MAPKFKNKNPNPTNKGSHLHMPRTKSGRGPRPSRAAPPESSRPLGGWGPAATGRGGAGRGPRGHVGRVPIPAPFLDRRNRDLSALGIRPPRRYGRLGRVQELLGAGPAAAPTGHRHRRGHGYRKGHRHGASAPGYASGPPGSSYLRSRGRQRHTLASGGFGSQEVGGRAGGHGLAKPRGCTCRRR